MKKIISLLLVLLFSLTVVGCGNNGGSGNGGSNNAQTLDDEIAKIVIPQRLTNSIELPTEALDGAITITWESSNQDVLSNDGCFFMPENDTDITLTATFSYEGETKTKVYNTQIYTKEKGWYVAYHMYEGGVQSVYTNNSPFSAPKYKDYTVKYESLDQGIITNEGIITQKDHDQEVVVRITISQGDAGQSRVYYKKAIVKEYSNETYAVLIADWAEQKLQEYIAGKIDKLPSSHEKWPSKIEWTSGDNIAITNEGTLIKPIEYVDDKLGLKVTYGSIPKEQEVIEKTILIENFGGSTESEFYDQWLSYIMPTDIFAHVNVLKLDANGEKTDQFDYQYAVNTGAVLNLMNGQPLTFDKSYFIDVDNETGLEVAWSGKHPALPNSLDEEVNNNKARISDLDAFYNHFKPFYGWDANATNAQKQAAYKEYKDNLGNDENILWIVVHESGMPFAGNDAELLAKIQRQQADGERGYRQASWNYQIDHEKIYQSFDDTVYCWHAGGDYGKYLPFGNRNSIGIEMCINEDGNYDGAMAHDAKLVAYLMNKYNLKMENVVRHHDTSGKICPNYMIETNRYGEFLEMVRNEYNAIKYLRDAEVTWTISNPELFDKGPHGLYYAKAVSEITEVQVTLKVVKGTYQFEKTVTITLRPDGK